MSSSEHPLYFTIQATAYKKPLGVIHHLTDAVWFIASCYSGANRAHIKIVWCNRVLWDSIRDGGMALGLNGRVDSAAIAKAQRIAQQNLEMMTEGAGFNKFAMNVLQHADLMGNGRPAGGVQTAEA